MPSEKSTSFSTVRFIADEHGSLQARIVLLNSGTKKLASIRFVCPQKSSQTRFGAMVARTQALPGFAQYFADRLRKGRTLPC